MSCRRVRLCARATWQHLDSKKRIEEGDGLPDLWLTTTCDDALKTAGFEIIETRDAALDPNPGGEAWYKILTPSYFSLFRLQASAPPALAHFRTCAPAHLHTRHSRRHTPRP